MLLCPEALREQVSITVVGVVFVLILLFSLSTLYRIDTFLLFTEHQTPFQVLSKHQLT